MKIMYVLPAEGFGGAERQGVLHIRKLAEWGIDLLAVVGSGAPVRHALQSYGFSDYRVCHDFPRSTHRKMRLGGNLRFAAQYAAAFFRSSRRLEDLGREAGVDLIFAGRSFGWAVAARAAHRLRIPYILRAGSRATSPAVGMGIRSLRAFYGRPAALLSNCAAVQDSIIRHFDCPGGIVPNGVDTVRFDPATAERTLGDRLGIAGRAIVGLAARPAPGKGLDIFAEAVGRVCQTLPNTRFLIAGEYGWRQHYEDRFAALGLADSVQFLGHVESMPEFLAACDLVVLTSQERSIEGSPNSILEAMSMARPIVASNVGGIPEIIGNGEQGYLVNPTDSSAFADRIVTILQDKGKAMRMGASGRARVLARHSEQAAMEALTGALHRFAGPQATKSEVRREKISATVGEN